MLINLDCPNCSHKGLNFKGVHVKNEHIGFFQCKRCNWAKFVDPTPENELKEEKKDENKC